MDNENLPDISEPLTNIQIVRIALMMHPDLEKPEVKEAMQALDVVESELGQLRRIAGPRVMSELLKALNRYEVLRGSYIADHPAMTLAEFDRATDELMEK